MVCVRSEKPICAPPRLPHAFVGPYVRGWSIVSPVLFSSVQIKMVSVRSERPICASPRLSAVSTTLPLKQFQCCLIDGGPLSSFRGRSPNASSFHAFLLQAIEGVMSLAFCPLVVSQTPQQFRSSETQATCEGFIARLSVCSVISLHSGMSRAVHPQSSKVSLPATRDW